MSVDLLFSNVAASEDFQLLKRIALDQCTMPELAHELGVSVEACKKRVQRARKRRPGLGELSGELSAFWPGQLRSL